MQKKGLIFLIYGFCCCLKTPKKHKFLFSLSLTHSFIHSLFLMPFHEKGNFSSSTFFYGGVFIILQLSQCEKKWYILWNKKLNIELVNFINSRIRTFSFKTLFACFISICINVKHFFVNWFQQSSSRKPSHSPNPCLFLSLSYHKHAVRIRAYLFASHFYTTMKAGALRFYLLPLFVT